jgi:hypothetical protein
MAAMKKEPQPNVGFCCGHAYCETHIKLHKCTPIATQTIQRRGSS